MKTKEIVVVGMSVEALDIYKKKLENLLEKKGKTLTALCHDSGIPIDPLHDILTGTKTLDKNDVSYLEAVCEYLGKDIESMIETKMVNNKVKIFYGRYSNLGFYKKNKDQIQLFKDACRDLSVERVNHHFELDNAIDLKEPLKDFSDNSNNVMSFIFGDLGYAQINLKIFFDRENISKIMNGLEYQGGLKSRTNEEIDDFMREYSNIMMGGIKKVFEASAPFMSTSLPIIMKDKNGLFLAPQDAAHDKENIVDRWKIKAKGTDIICEINFEVYNPQRFSLAMEHTNFKRDDLSNQVFVF
jgi:uncharacterized protein YutD